MAQLVHEELDALKKLRLQRLVLYLRPHQLVAEQMNAFVDLCLAPA